MGDSDNSDIRAVWEDDELISSIGKGENPHPGDQLTAGLVAWRDEVRASPVSWLELYREVLVNVAAVLDASGHIHGSVDSAYRAHRSLNALMSRAAGKAARECLEAAKKLRELAEHIPAVAGPVELYEQWCVFYGGPDPDNCAGWEERYGQVDAQERLQWMVHAGVAHRTMYAGAWMIDHQPGEIHEKENR